MGHPKSPLQAIFTKKNKQIQKPSQSIIGDQLSGRELEELANHCKQIIYRELMHFGEQRDLSIVWRQDA